LQRIDASFAIPFQCRLSSVALNDPQSDDQISNISAALPFSRDFFKIAVWIHQTSITKHRIPSFIHPQFNKGIVLVVTLTLEAP
jgi:hypothetical protein